jgi:hypothetical protein
MASQAKPATDRCLIAAGARDAGRPGAGGRLAKSVAACHAVPRKQCLCQWQFKPVLCFNHLALLHWQEVLLLGAATVCFSKPGHCPVQEGTLGG